LIEEQELLKEVIQGFLNSLENNVIRGE